MKLHHLLDFIVDCEVVNVSTSCVFRLRGNPLTVMNNEIANNVVSEKGEKMIFELEERCTEQINLVEEWQVSLSHKIKNL